MCVCVCVCVCVLTYICWSQSPNPSHPLSPSMLCFQSVISLKFLQQSQDILGTHTLSAPVPSVFVHLQQQTWCLWELYEVQLVLLGVWRTEESGSDQSPGSTWSLTLGAWREEREMMSYLLSREYIYLLSLPFPYLLFLQTYIQCWVCTRHIESDCHLPSGRVKSSGEQAVSVVKHSRDLWDRRDGQLYQMGGFLEVVLFELSLKG